MRVLINAASANMGGAVTYLNNVTRWLPKVGAHHEFIIYAPEPTRGKLQKLGHLPNVRLEPYPYEDTGGKERLYFDQVTIPRLVRSENIDVLFSSTGFGTFMSPCPQVILIRNPVYFNKDFQDKYKELGRSLRRTTIRRWHSLLSIKRSDIVLFPTLAMQQMVEQYMKLGKKRTQAIHYGFDHEAFKGNDDVTPDIVLQMKKWKGEGYHLILNVSTYAVHKNFETLIEALPALVKKGIKVKLLTTTSREKTADKEEYDKLKQRAVELGVDGAWVELGYVAYQQLHMLYENVDLFAFPSFTESFGHSLVEAMAANLPVVAADMPVNREVCGDAGVYFNIYDPMDCASKMHETLCAEEKKKRMIDASMDRAKHFSWHSYTERLLTVFQEAATE